MRMRMVLVCAVMGACCAIGNAQMGTACSAGPAVGTAVEPSKALDDLLKLYEDEAVGGEGDARR